MQNLIRIHRQRTINGKVAQFLSLKAKPLTHRQLQHQIDISQSRQRRAPLNAMTANSRMGGVNTELILHGLPVHHEIDNRRFHQSTRNGAHRASSVATPALSWSLAAATR